MNDNCTVRILKSEGGKRQEVGTTKQKSNFEVQTQEVQLDKDYLQGFNRLHN